MPKLGVAEIRKPQLIEATMEAINAVGLQKANVVMISGYAGVSPAIINHHFGGKDNLLEATMRSVLKQLSDSIRRQLADVPREDVMGRLNAIVRGNFDDTQVDSRVVKTWLAFWTQSMHNDALFRLQRVNEKRLLSYLTYELCRVLPRERARFVAQTVAALIDGIWLRGALTPEGINVRLAQQLINDYIRQQLPAELVGIYDQRVAAAEREQE
ncbi:transcriptional regulator BetI [Parathalassolituus penaei]|uniref:HTH-type transcriptional regulator BetI n=1 Tax=Parathalassolituus penaei TaxID=2997323 RepID=A0A9X3ISE2_9GAMM|nr:transcriptional regulator BetI [Parathalassolituus penaei]MCY0966277.1 transcriptional regulator BetI [Parathalassolituus penaei]